MRTFDEIRAEITRGFVNSANRKTHDELGKDELGKVCTKYLFQLCNLAAEVNKRDSASLTQREREYLDILQDINQPHQDEMVAQTVSELEIGGRVDIYKDGYKLIIVKLKHEDNISISESYNDDRTFVSPRPSDEPQAAEADKGSDCTED